MLLRRSFASAALDSGWWSYPLLWPCSFNSVRFGFNMMVWGQGSGIWGLRNSDLRSTVSGFGLRASGFVFRATCFLFRVSCFLFLVSRFLFLVSRFVFWCLVGSVFGVQEVEFRAWVAPEIVAWHECAQRWGLWWRV